MFAIGLVAVCTKLIAEIYDFLVQPDLLPDIRDHQLKLMIAIIEETLIVRDLLVDVKVLVVECLQLFQLVHELLTDLHNVAFLELDAAIRKDVLEAFQVLDLLFKEQVHLILICLTSVPATTILLLDAIDKALGLLYNVVVKSLTHYETLAFLL